MWFGAENKEVDALVQVKFPHNFWEEFRMEPKRHFSLWNIV